MFIYILIILLKYKNIINPNPSLDRMNYIFI